MQMTLSRWASLSLLLLTLALPTVRAADGTAAIEDYFSSHQEAWKAKIPAKGTRLLFQDGDWDGVKAKVAAAPDRWRGLFFKKADEIAAMPMPVYAEPDKLMGGKGQPKTPFDANQELWQRPIGDDMVALALAGKISDDAKYNKALHDLVIDACGFTTWGKYGPNMDLSCDHLSRGIAFAWDWHRDIFSADEQALIIKTITARTGALYQGFQTGKAFWASDSSVNHNQNAAGGLGLAGLAFYNDIPDAPHWLAAAMVDYDKMAKEANADGSSAEGVPYWTYGMSFVLPFIEATKKITGADSYYDLPFLKNAASYRIGVATPGLGALPMWGDAVPTDFYGPQNLLYLMASHYHDAGAQYVADHIPFNPKGGADVLVWTLLWCDPSVPSVAPTALDYHAADWDVATTRSGWADTDYYLSLKSGFTNRNHSHLDAGAIVFSFGDEWLIRTPGYGKGEGEKAYWDNKGGGRWDFFSCASESHATLLIDGQNQLFDPEARGTIGHFLSADGESWIDANLTRAYGGVDSVRRRLFHRRGDYLLVLDDVAAPKTVKAEWLLQAGATGQASGSVAHLPGTKGSLAVQILGDGSGFALRAPTRPNVDIAPGSQQTFAAERDGTKADFSVLLLPQPAGSAPSAFKASVVETPGQRTVTITGADWEDHVMSADTAVKVAMGKHSSITAQAAAWRTGKNGKLSSFSCVQAEELVTRAMHLKGAATDVSLDVDPATNNGWVLNFGSAFAGDLIPAKGLQLFDASGAAVASGTVSLPAGRYLLHP